MEDNLTEINGVISGVRIGTEGFIDEFRDWLESKGYEFAGSIGPYEDDNTTE